MSRFAAAVFALSLIPSAAFSAEITRIASSFEENHPFGMLIQVSYERLQEQAALVRQTHQNNTVQDVNELNWKLVEQRLSVDLRIGIYKDVEFHYKLPVIFNRNQSWKFANGTDAQNSTLIHNCAQDNGQITDPNCAQNGVGEVPIYNNGIPYNSYRGGIGNMVFGLKWAVFNQAKDDTKPTWLLGLDYEAPTAKLLNPTEQVSDPSNRGQIGDKNHHYTFFTALSKRSGAADPYFKAYYTLPVRGPGWYSNCDNPGVVGMGARENCNTSAWTRSDTGINLPQQVGVLFGSEFVPFEDVKKSQKIAVDLRGIVNFVGAGRYSNELSDLAGRLLSSQEYLQVGGRLGLVAYAAEYFQVSANATLTYNTEHTITAEKIGKDLNGNGTVDVTANPSERNPNFDWRTDLVSRQLRATQEYNFGFQLMATLAF